MNTRLRVLYTDDKCEPFLAESGLLMTLQTKSVRLPINAQHVKIIVEKDLFAEKWRVAYNGTLNNLSECIRITGATFSSKIEPCKQKKKKKLQFIESIYFDFNHLIYLFFSLYIITNKLAIKQRANIQLHTDNIQTYKEKIYIERDVYYCTKTKECYL